MTVLDSSAVLAFLFDEPGAVRVASVVGASLMSTVNLAETLAVVERQRREPGPVLQLLRELGLAFVLLDEDLAERTAALEGVTRDLGVSLGDRACLALAMRMDRPALTADRAWTRLQLPVRIELVR